MTVIAKYLQTLIQLPFTLSYMLHTSMIICINVTYSSFHSSHQTELYAEVPATCLPIVYSPEYNITFMGLEKLHPFDAGKWGKVIRFLKGVQHNCRWSLPGRHSDQCVRWSMKYDTKRIGESKSCKSVQEWRVVGRYRWRDAEKDREKSNQWGRDNEGSWTPFGNRSKRMLASQLLLQGQGQSVTLAALQIN